MANVPLYQAGVHDSGRVRARQRLARLVLTAIALIILGAALGRGFVTSTVVPGVRSVVDRRGDDRGGRLSALSAALHRQATVEPTAEVAPAETETEPPDESQRQAIAGADEPDPAVQSLVLINRANAAPAAVADPTAADAEPEPVEAAEQPDATQDTNDATMAALATPSHSSVAGSPTVVFVRPSVASPSSEAAAAPTDVDPIEPSTPAPPPAPATVAAPASAVLGTPPAPPGPGAASGADDDRLRARGPAAGGGSGLGGGPSPSSPTAPAPSSASRAPAAGGPPSSGNGGAGGGHGPGSDPDDHHGGVGGALSGGAHHGGGGGNQGPGSGDNGATRGR